MLKKLLFLTLLFVVSCSSSETVDIVAQAVPTPDSVNNALPTVVPQPESYPEPAPTPIPSPYPDSSGAIPSMADPLSGTSWTLVNYNGNFSMSQNAHITFDNQSVSGNGGCNEFGGKYVADANNGLAVMELFSTEMACEDSMDQETAVLAALSSATEFVRNNTGLEIIHPDGRLIFMGRAIVSENDLPLEGTFWQFDGFVEGDAVSMPNDGTELNVQFIEGKVTGYSGCNDFFGDYAADGNNVFLQPLGLTKRACDEPTGAQEFAFVEALQSSITYRITESFLAIQHPGGELLFVAQPK